MLRWQTAASSSYSLGAPQRGLPTVARSSWRPRSQIRGHSAAGIYPSQPGLGPVLAARVLAEFGDDPGHYATAKGCKNYASTSPITRASGKKRWSWPAMRATTGPPMATTSGRLAPCAPHQAPAYYDELRAQGKGHNAALRQFGNWLVGILHGCLKTGTRYDEHTTWGHRYGEPEPAAA
jgi:Transposase IS116/IS110/IS902 family